MAYGERADEMGDYLGKVSQKFDINIAKYQENQQKQYISTENNYYLNENIHNL